jgi:hypothetical protein
MHIHVLLLGSHLMHKLIPQYCHGGKQWNIGQKKCRFITTSDFIIEVNFILRKT